MKAHPDKKLMDELFPAVREYQALASKHGIGDIFQDNGGKLLQLILTLGLEVIPGREGNDAKDETGREFELKSVNLDLTKSFSTHHHLNPTILAKYRQVGWVFGIYRGIELVSIHSMEPSALEPLFSSWEERWNTNSNRDLNNPKIPVKLVVETGKLMYGAVPEISTRRPKPESKKPPFDPFDTDDQK